MHAAQNAGVLAQLFGEGRVHFVGFRGGNGLRHRALGHYAVLFNQIGQHIPLPAVVERRHQKMRNQPAAAGLLQRLQNAFQKVIRLLQLIIKQRIVLRQLKGLQIQVFHHLKPQAVERGEHPAAAALLLIGDLSLFQAD